MYKRQVPRLRPAQGVGRAERDAVHAAQDVQLRQGEVSRALEPVSYTHLIHTTVFRGELSEGMMCSLKELGLTLHDFPYGYEDGLFILQEDCKPGDDIRPVIGRDDHVVEFEITPNRSDCLSVIGLAREAAVTFNKTLKLHEPVVKGCGGGKTVADYVRIDIENPDLCPRYTARMVKNVKIAPSPKWMRERIAAMGMRPINNIVDITNYVMMEYGQPMHAFDFACVDGDHIVVRTAREGETIRTLDEMCISDRATTSPSWQTPPPAGPRPCVRRCV